MSDLIGKTVAIELTVAGGSRIVCGVIVEDEQSVGGALHIALAHSDRTGGSPVLIIASPHLCDGKPFGCDYLLRLSQSTRDEPED